METKKNLHFRVNTPQLLQEILENSTMSMGIFRVPFNTFKGLLAQVAKRAAEINDPIMNKLMFDLALYELPDPCTTEYEELMDKLYKEAEKATKPEAS